MGAPARALVFEPETVELSLVDPAPRAQPSLLVLEGGLLKNRPPVLSTPSRRILLLGSSLIVLQLLDLLLTYIGVSRFGIHAEGNPLIRALMAFAGELPALLLVKLAAIAIIVGLVSISRRVWWISHMMTGLIAVYLVAAILPWCGILLYSLT